MKATKDYGPCTTCGQPIKKGDEFVIVGGEFHHSACQSGDAPAAAPAEAPAEAPKPKPRKRAPAKPAEAKPEAKAPAKPKAAPKTTKKAAAPKAQPKAQPKAPAKQEGTEAKPKPAAKPKPKGTVTKVAESPNGVTVRLLCGRQSTDDEIVKAVLKQFPDRDEKRIRADISVNRSELNRGNYKSAREKYGLGPDEKVEKLVKVGKERVPASQAPEAGK